jgi:hypothetical protein
MPEPWKLTGRVKGNTFELETELRNVPATRNGEQTSVPRRWVFRGSADGDKITGKMSLAGGEGEEPTHSFSAVRKRQSLFQRNSRVVGDVDVLRAHALGRSLLRRGDATASHGHWSVTA